MKVRIPIRRGLCGLFLCCMLAPGLARAQSEWTEEECIRYALAHNLRIRNKQLDIRMAQTDLVTAYGDFLPSIRATGALGKKFGRSIDPRTNQYTDESFLENTMDLNVSLPVFEGFSRIHQLNFRKWNRGIKVLQSKMEENDLAFEVLEAFYRHCFDKEMHRLAVEQRRLSESYCEQMREYVGLGMRSLSDWQEVKARLQSDIYQETVQSNHSRLSLLALKELMNLKDADTLSVVMGDEEQEGVVLPLSWEALYAASESMLPEFQSMEMKESASRASLAMAKGACYPSIRMEWGLNTGYYDTEKDKSGGIVPFPVQLKHNRGKYVGISLSLPLFTGLSRWGAVRKEKFRLQQVRHENELQRLSLYKEIRQAYLSLQAAWQESHLARAKFRGDSITWRESEAQWKEGMISSFELLEKRNRYMRAKAEIMRTKMQWMLKKRMIRFYQEGSFL